jgi:heme/copper-type cytochrome/quinol oxidase subunit 2
MNGKPELSCPQRNFVARHHDYIMANGNVSGSLALLLVGLSVVFGGCVRKAATSPLVKSVTIEMTGKDFRWSSRYAGPDGKLHTSDDLQEAEILTVPVGARIDIQLKSNDFIYSLEVPHKGASEIAVPDMTFHLEFDADKTGTFSLPGEQLCGYAHPDLMATLIVVSQSDFFDWQKRQAVASKNDVAKTVNMIEQQ